MAESAEPELPIAVDRLRELATTVIQDSLEGGTVYKFVTPDGLTDANQRILDIYQEVAKELGYELGFWEQDQAKPYLLKARIKPLP